MSSFLRVTDERFVRLKVQVSESRGAGRVMVVCRMTPSVSSLVRRQVVQGLFDVVEENGKLRGVVFADLDRRLLEGGSVDDGGQVQLFTPDVAQTREMDYVRVGSEDGLDEQLGHRRALGLLGQIKNTPGHFRVKSMALQSLACQRRCKADMARDTYGRHGGACEACSRSSGQARTLALIGQQGQGSRRRLRGYVTRPRQ
jgi:hypothetical protein